jgi:thiol:disulfide interchange protein DsbG
MKKPVILLWCLLSALTGLATAGTSSTLPAATSGALVQRLEHAQWIATGAKTSNRVVYVFSDPNCPYCNDLWKAMKTARAADVQIRYLLVAVIDADSRGKDGAILESKDPAAALEQHERDFDRGGIAPKEKLATTSQQAIFVNEQLMTALGIIGTPGLVYVDQHKEVHVFAGMPNPGQLDTIVGKR